MESFAAAPKGKLPYIVDDHEKIANSNFIIDYLKRNYGDPLDAKLDPAERAAGHAMKRMIEENFYWVIIAERWRDTKAAIENYPVMIGQPPEFVKVVVDNMLGELRGHGMGRHTADEIENLGKADLVALADFLGDNPCLLGRDPTSYDATAYSFVAHIIQADYNSRMKKFIKTLPNSDGILGAVHVQALQGEWRRSLVSPSCIQLKTVSRMSCVGRRVPVTSRLVPIARSGSEAGVPSHRRRC